MKPRVYIETSIVSYLTARPSRDIVQAAHQQLTVDWWTKRGQFELFVSEAVIEEARRGDAAAAARRLEAVSEPGVLVATREAQELARALLLGAALPRKAAVDAVHVAIATVHGMDYLLTWNCTHIANAMMRPRIEAVCKSNGYLPPVICTPEELIAVESI